MGEERTEMTAGEEALAALDRILWQAGTRGHKVDLSALLRWAVEFAATEDPLPSTWSTTDMSLAMREVARRVDGWTSATFRRWFCGEHYACDRYRCSHCAAVVRRLRPTVTIEEVLAWAKKQ